MNSWAIHDAHSECPKHRIFRIRLDRKNHALTTDVWTQSINFNAFNSYELLIPFLEQALILYLLNKYIRIIKRTRCTNFSNLFME